MANILHTHPPPIRKGTKKPKSEVFKVITEA